MPTTTSLKALLEDNTIPADSALIIAEADGLRCLACGHRCLVKPGRAGTCRVRFNREGELRVPAGYVAGIQIDPIEKKPFFHAFPGRDALSFGMLGCDLHCSYCQNWVTSQALRDDDAVSLPKFCSPDELVALALQHDSPVLVSTYNEPLITSEWAVEIFKRAKAAGLTGAYVSNGNATPEVLRFIRPYVDLYKVDLKSFDDRRYRELGGVLANVLATIQQLVDMGFWVEIVTLLIPGFNDSDDELKKIAAFLAQINPDLPWHVSAFHPDYRMTDPPATPAETLLRACEIGKAAGLHYIYPGNLPGQFGDRENTNCPKCQTPVISRRGFLVTQNTMTAPGQCPNCATAIPGRWQPNPPAQSAGPGFPRSIAL